MKTIVTKEDIDRNLILVEESKPLDLPLALFDRKFRVTVYLKEYYKKNKWRYKKK